MAGPFGTWPMSRPSSGWCLCRGLRTVPAGKPSARGIGRYWRRACRPLLRWCGILISTQKPWGAGLGRSTRGRGFD